MKHYTKVFLLTVLLLLIIPFSFASDNDTAIGDSNELTANNIYFDSSASSDGDGSQSSPYKYLEADRIRDNSVAYFADGEYSLDEEISRNNLTIIGNNPSKTVIKSDSLNIISHDSLKLSKITLNDLTITNYNNLTATNVIFQNSKGAYNSGYDNIFGGAIYTTGSGNALIQSSTFKDNTAGYAGAIYVSNSNLKVVNSVFQNNNAYKYGGAIASENSNLEVISSSFINCYTITNAGGAIYAKDSTITVKKSNFTSCNATFGGAVCDLASASTIDSIIANNNRADYQGGAIYKMYGTMSITSSSFTSNEALNGGGVFADNSSSFVLKSSKFTSNKAKYVGGAIYTILNTKETVESITYKDNKAASQNNYYKGTSYNLFIGNGNYTQYIGNFSFDGKFPSRYDLRDYGWVTPVKHQKSSGNCWAFTSLASLESCILKASGTAFDLSEENMKNVIAYYSDYGWKLTTNKGGYDDMGVGYLVSWLGAVEEDMETFSDHSVLSPVLDSNIHVQNLIYLTRSSFTDNNKVKEALIKYGAVATGIYYSGSYNKNNYYYYNGDRGCNHAITIVGWDDTISKNKFKNTPEGDGAWICKNSWGESWGDNGYFYISYYDTRCVRVGDYDKSTYTIILNDTVHYDKNYQYDIIGITDYLITGKDTIWYENIYNATGDELLTAFSTYFNATTNWTAQIYVNNALKLTMNGMSDAGYYTFNLDSFIPLKKGDTFKIVIKISVKGKLASFPISEKVRSNRVLYSKGVSFFSYDGKTWTDLYDFKLNMSQYGHTYESQVACIKAFTTTETLKTKISLTNPNVVAVNAPFNVTATVKDQYGNLVNYGKVKFTLDSKSYTVSVVNGKATLTAKLTSKGIYNLEAAYVQNAYYSASSASRKINASVTSPDLKLIIPDITYGNRLVVKNTLLSGNVKVTANVDVKIKSKTYSMPSNSQITIDDILEPGKYTASASCSDAASATATFNVNKLPLTMSLNIAKTDVDGADITVKLSKPLNGTVKINVNSKSYNVNAKNGVGLLSLSNLDYGNYTVKASFSDKYYQDASAEGKFTVNKIKTTLNADNLVMYYHDGSRFYVTLKDKNNKGIPNQDIVITLNGVDNPRTTKDDGSTSIAINLNSGNYSVLIKYAGNGKYLSSSLSRNITVKSTVIASDLVKYYRNATQFHATILDYNGAKVVNKKVSMNINGVFYNRTTNSKGQITLNINLEPKSYILTVINPVTGENSACNITVLSKFKDNHDLVKYYKNASRYSVRVLDDVGNPLSGGKVTFNINGVLYERTTKSDGTASLAINLEPGTYIITAEHEGLKVSNTIKVLTVIKTKDIVMTYKDGTKFTATILDGLGNPYPGQKLTFNINGVLYDRTTKSDGTASLSINLMPAKYIITTSYNGLNAANTITVKSA